MGYTQPFFNVRKITGGYSIFPDGVTTDDLTIYPNPIDTTGWLKIEGGGRALIGVTAGYAIAFYDGSTNYLNIIYSTPDIQINPLVNKNVFLNPTGTGRVKFGTYTAGAATDSTGYIDIIDAGGTARKLMVQA